MEFFVQEISAQAFRSLKAAGLDFAESIQVIRDRFEKIQRGISTSAIIEVHPNIPTIFCFFRFTSDGPLALWCSNDTNSQARLAGLW